MTDFLDNLQKYLIKVQKEDREYFNKAPDGDGYIEYGRADLAGEIINLIKTELANSSNT